MNEQELLKAIQFEIETYGISNVNKITKDSPLTSKDELSIGLDSLDQIALCMELEKLTKKYCADKTMSEFKTVGNIIDYFKD
jgi:acyl carrier protein